MEEKEYLKLKKYYLSRVLKGEDRALGSLKILEESWQNQAKAEQAVRLAEEKERREKYKSELEYNKFYSDKALAERHAKLEENKAELEERLAKSQKKFQTFQMVVSVVTACLTFGGSIATTILVNKSREREIDALTKFEKDGTPTSMASKTVVQNNLKR